ncbi:class I SAM-dependent methyltransferase [Methanosarcina siciliae]|uniref:class I SAM-dependent methyltransferase n=1 Tax=Methanosarcina siciliae TaxID=38027 RepID=UPI00064F9722|nr:class I SAM-dependent methyltransferase [Methanosarcina siciliae]
MDNKPDLQDITPNLQGIPETLLIPLWARAVEAEQTCPIIKDTKAAEIMNGLDYDFTKFANAWKSQIGVVVRTKLLDQAVRSFIQKYPDAVVVNIGCGLDTRFVQVDNGRMHWYDLDLPEVIRIRQNFFVETDHYRMIAKSVFDDSWMDEICVTDEPVLIIAEGLLMYFTVQEVKTLLNKLISEFPGGEMLLEVMSPDIVKMSKRHDAIGRMDAKFRWGIKDSQELETYNQLIKVVNEWNYFDYHKDRWGWLGWLAVIPAFKNHFNNRIVHLQFT